ncbi:MAG TPA: helix-hairpin-helix domain-containing protein [Leucothrix mucor]|uniref:Helix-hairpin-helix domain-containing protein n=1 Tax=Leucothrix mucor TaxID=45248 RepID=A0A7V2T246_LEUMU|nr:helix-hairpin-helix domain-containing protein [Leucothrix mucor]
MNIKSLVLAVILSILSLSSFAEVVNINKADVATFQYYLNGIGVKKASSIIKYRTENKHFKTLAEIKKVHGIGEKIFNKIKENISLTGDVVSISKTKTKTVEKKIKIEVIVKKENKNKIEKITEDEVENTEIEKLDSE